MVKFKATKRREKVFFLPQAVDLHKNRFLFTSQARANAPVKVKVLSKKMREICAVVVVLAAIASTAIISDSPNESVDLSEEQFIKNLTSIVSENRGRNTKLRSKIKEMLKKPQVPPINGDPVEAVQSRIPCECKNGICSCCIGGFFFNNKGCMKMKYIPEDFAFDLRMTFNDNTLYKNTISGKNPRPICISPPRFQQFLEICAKFHDIYFIGRNMHVCLDVTASIGDYDLVDR